ncbi:MAG TPA: NAD(P)/FAD-dependent oxidoreductase [Bauldia sp.]|nr:NAD(P)/FAD-dependent oxidoreductase [Bauldia sp.]
MDQVECIVAGAGVVGLAVARALALSGREVLVLEAAPAIGTETSSRNSEVIHAGIYYRKDSLMARFCVAGRQMLYRYLEERGVPHRRTGKLIVATDADEIGKLAGIRERAAANGVDDMRVLSKSGTLALEPGLRAEGALLSPSTGIIDSHAYMLSLQGDAEDAGATVAFHAPLASARVTGDGFAVTAGGAEPFTLACRILVNAAGLHAPALARTIAGMPPEKVPQAFFAKGNYFTLAGRAPFTRLIYPVPVPGGLGTHLTLDLAGQARFGPDVEWVDRIGYDVDPARGALFYDAIRRYWPDLPDGALQPGYSGIRPKIVPPEVAGQDFVVQGPADHGVPGLVNLFGIESPGLTASLALADHVRERLTA